MADHEEGNGKENGNLKLEEYSSKRIPWKLVKKAHRIVIKIGTKALIKSDRSFDNQFFDTLAEDIKDLVTEGKEIILVSSGAVNAGVNALGLPERPKEIIVQQAMAAVGNPLLMTQYQKYFTFCKIGQVLVTQEDFSNRESYKNLRNTLEEMIKRQIIPIINENDVVSVRELLSEGEIELNFTDNDILAGIVSASMEADLCIIFSDVEGLYTKHPNSPYAQFLAFVPKITEEIFAMGKKGSKFGRGGMTSKLIAADIVTRTNGTAIIANAKKCRIKEIFQGKTTLTLFLPNSENFRNKEIWMIFGANLKGKIIIDIGAQNAIRNGASLLFQGIRDWSGVFNKGDIITVLGCNELNGSGNKTEEVIARGKINYSSEELERFKRMSPEHRKEFFLLNKIREIISHENIVFTLY